MKLLDGLFFYEIVLLVLGVVLFVVLVIALLRLVFQGKPFGGLLAFFALPVAMIGYPSIKSIEIDKDTIKIEKLTQSLRDDPTSPATRDDLKKAVTNAAARPITDARRVVVLASAQFALGDEKVATANLQKAARADPAAPGVADLQNRIAVVRNLDRLATDAEANPNDPKVVAELSGALSEATKHKFADPKALTAIARAQVAVGDHTRALENVNHALAIDPTSQVASSVKSRITATEPRPAPSLIAK